ncbi:MAG TPA: NTP transferase domain-containing protein [Anaerolineae bacterium]|nr:NTP transferase domain-containing protein [Anaerolineae bacterium]
MHAIIAAGGIPQPGEPLYPLTQGQNKALLEIAGKPMIQWVLDAISGSKKIDCVVVIGLPPSVKLNCKYPINYLKDHHSMIENVQAGARAVLKEYPNASKVLLFSSDIPTITPKIVDWMVTEVESSDHDLYYSVIERCVMEKRFPSSNRTFIKLKDIQVCGGDMHAVKIQTAIQGNTLYQEIANARKNALKQASLIGWGVVFLILTRKMTLADGVRLISKRLGLSGRVIISPYAEVGMDVDKPVQYKIVKSDLL